MKRKGTKKVTAEAVTRCLSKNLGRNQIKDREIAESHYFHADGTFTAIDRARDLVEKKGYSKGSMQRDYPIAIAEGELYISKWGNLGSDVSRIGGVILPDPDFREGGALVLFFK